MKGLLKFESRVDETAVKLHDILQLRFVGRDEKFDLSNWAR